MKLCLAIVFLFISNTAFGCSCSGRPLDQAFKNADYVYVGRVISASVTPDDVVESILLAKEVFKGKPDQFVVVSAASQKAQCEGVVIVGENYIVFGQYGKKPVLHSCSDTQMLQYPEQVEEFWSGS